MQPTEAIRTLQSGKTLELEGAVELIRDGPSLLLSAASDADAVAQTADH